jgi:hypothetical protein
MWTVDDTSIAFSTNVDDGRGGDVYTLLSSFSLSLMLWCWCGV